MSAYRVTYPDGEQVTVDAEHDLAAVRAARFMRGETASPYQPIGSVTVRVRDGVTTVRLNYTGDTYTVERVP